MRQRRVAAAAACILISAGLALAPKTVGAGGLFGSATQLDTAIAVPPQGSSGASVNCSIVDTIKQDGPVIQFGGYDSCSDVIDQSVNAKLTETPPDQVVATAPSENCACTSPSTSATFLLGIDNATYASDYQSTTTAPPGYTWSASGDCTSNGNVLQCDLRLPLP